MRPSYKRPYYFIHNINTLSDSLTQEGKISTVNDLPTDVINKNATIPLSKGVDQNGTDDTTFDRTVGSIDLVEKPAATRVANPSKVRIEIRYGKDDRIFQLENIMVDYIKAPQFIRLTQEQIDTTEDTSQIMEFPNSICQEIINELVSIVMENASDPRLQTHPIVSQSIASPAQQQSQSKK